MPLIVGLGNPGPEYEGTRHNVGFRVLDRLVTDLLAGDGTAGEPAASGGAGSRPLFLPGRKLEGYRGPRAFRWARSATPAALLVKPETFMNLSGDVVLPLARWLHGPSAGAAEPGFDPARILVVYDDLDLPLGALRIRPHGGAGGHNGMRSIRDRLLTDRFPRLRVGIGSSRTDAARHVLSTFTDAEEVEIQISIAEAAEALRHWLGSGDLDECMTRFHSRWNQG